MILFYQKNNLNNKKKSSEPVSLRCVGPGVDILLFLCLTRSSLYTLEKPLQKQFLSKYYNYIHFTDENIIWLHEPKITLLKSHHLFLWTMVLIFIVFLHITCHLSRLSPVLFLHCFIFLRVHCIVIST